MRKGLLIVVAYFFITVMQAAAPVHAEAPAPALDRTICAPDGVALGGFDVVSYFTHGTGPVPGDPAHVVKRDNLQYRFANEANKRQFVSDPQRYLPSYLGWCSTNLSMGRLACPDYSNYKIENDSLLLFERVGFTNGRDVWNSNPLQHRQQANTNFEKFSQPDSGNDTK